MTSPQAVDRMIRDRMAPQPRVGVVTSVGSSSVSVAFEDGTATSDVMFTVGYAPAVGHQVLVVPTTSSWVAVSRVTAVSDAAPDAQAVVPARAVWWKSRPANYGDGLWRRSGPVERPPGVSVLQGRMPIQEGAVGVQQTRMDDNATIVFWDDIASRIPTGSTVLGATFTLYRQTVDAGPELSPPVIYGHAHTLTNPPPVSGAPTHVPGFGPLELPTLGHGEEATFALPSSWSTALLSGQLTGITFYSNRTDQALTSWGPSDNAFLMLPYIPAST